MEDHGISALLRKKLLLVVAVTSLSAALLFALVFAPLYTRSVNDIGFGFDYLADILDITLLLLHLVSFFICYAVTIYSVYRFSLSKSLAVIITFCGATVLKYALNLISSWFLYDGVPTAPSEIRLAVTSVSFNAALEIAQYFIVVLAVFLVMRRHNKLVEFSRRHALKAEDINIDEKFAAVPFKKMYLKSNPIQKSALISALVVAAIRVISRFISDFGSSISYDGSIDLLPSSVADGIWVAIYYTSDIALSLAGYLLMLLVILKLDTLSLKLKLRYGDE